MASYRINPLRNPMNPLANPRTLKNDEDFNVLDRYSDLISIKPIEIPALVTRPVQFDDAEQQLGRFEKWKNSLRRKKSIEQKPGRFGKWKNSLERGWKKFSKGKKSSEKDLFFKKHGVKKSEEKPKKTSGWAELMKKKGKSKDKPKKTSKWDNIIKPKRK